jgi:4'-phosphopantetheinyl transferase
MARFRFEPDRRAFAFARGMLRLVLASYLGIDPGEVRLSYSQHGKPSLAPPQSQSRVQFNLSHTAGYILIAICLGHTIGVDVEKLRSDFEVEELATRFFSPAERRSLKRLPKAQRRKAFFRCWTRKESLLKARGGGLLLPLEDFDVSIGPTEATVKLATRPDPQEAKQWIILNVDVPDEYAAAVTVGH